MKYKLALIAGLAALIAPALAPASAQQIDLYGNLGYTQFDGDAVDPGGVIGRLGVGFGKYFAVEGEATVGTHKDGGVKLENEFGAYGVARLPITDRFDIFARAGVASVDTKPGGSDSSFAYGAGAQYFFTEKDGIRGDWTRHDFDNGGDVDAYAISYVRKF